MLSARTPIRRGMEDPRDLLRQLKFSEATHLQHPIEHQTPRQVFDEQQRQRELEFMASQIKPEHTPMKSIQAGIASSELRRRNVIKMRNSPSSADIINRSPDRSKMRRHRILDNPVVQTESDTPEPTRTSTEAKHDQPRPSPCHRMNDIIDEVTTLMEERDQQEELDQLEESEEQPPQ